EKLPSRFLPQWQCHLKFEAADCLVPLSVHVAGETRHDPHNLRARPFPNHLGNFWAPYAKFDLFFPKLQQAKLPRVILPRFMSCRKMKCFAYFCGLASLLWPTLYNTNSNYGSPVRTAQTP